MSSLLIQATTGVRLTDTRVGSAPHQDLPGANPFRPAPAITSANRLGVFSPEQNAATPARKRSEKEPKTELGNRDTPNTKADGTAPQP